MESKQQQSTIIVSIGETIKASESVPAIPISTSPEANNLAFNIESQLKEARTERDEAMEDRDRLFKILERRSKEIKRLDADLKVLRQQLQDSINLKCEAVRKFEEVQHRVTETEFKEKRFIHERNLAQTQIEMLSNDLARNIQELQKCRKESSARIMMLEASLHEKSSEMQMSMMTEAQLSESNQKLTSKVDELSKELLRTNQDFSVSMKKYQQELSSKSRIVELFKEQSEDAVDVQKEVTAVVSELRASLKEATDEYGKLETKFKQNEIQHQIDIEELTKLIEDLKHELQNANHLLQAAKRENLDIAVENLCPSVVGQSRLTEVYSMYVNASEDLDVLNMEHEMLKETFSAVVHEIEEKAPEIQSIQVKFRKLIDAYETLNAEHKTIKDERIDAQEKIEMLLSNVSNLNQKCMELEMENMDLGLQVCQLLKVTEGKPGMENLENLSIVEELQVNNEKLVGLVRELAAVIQQVDNSQAEDEANLESSGTQATPIQDEQMEVSINENQEIQELKKALQTSEHNLKVLIAKNEQMLTKNEELRIQLDQLNAQLSDTSESNFKLRVEVEHKESQLKIQQTKYDMTKQKIQSLEGKLKNSELTVAKLETSLTHLHDEIQNYAAKLSKSENLIASLMNENKNLIKTEAELRIENEMHKKQQNVQTQMLSSLEFIKAAFEQQGSSTKMAEELEEMSQKCKELERLLASEQQKFEDFKTQAEATIKEQEDHNQSQVSILEEEIEEKSLEKAQEMTTELSKKDEELQQQEEELEVQSNDSSQKEALEFISCVGSLSNLEAFASANDFIDPQNDQPEAELEVKSAAQKRQREEEDDDESEDEETSHEIVGDKRVKMESSTEDEDELDTQNEEFQIVYNEVNFLHVDINVEEIEREFENYEILEEKEDIYENYQEIEEIFAEYFSEN